MLKFAIVPTMLSIGTIIVTFLMCMAGMNYFFEEKRIMLVDDQSEDESKSDWSFSYCKHCFTCEAFQPIQKMLPTWAENNPNIIVTVAPVYSIKVLTSAGMILADDTDYIVKVDNDLYVVPEEEFENKYSKIKYI